MDLKRNTKFQLSKSHNIKHVGEGSLVDRPAWKKLEEEEKHNSLCDFQFGN